MASSKNPGLHAETVKVFGLDQFVDKFLTPEQTQALAERVSQAHSFGDANFVGISPSELISDLQYVEIEIPEWLHGLEQVFSTGPGYLFEITNQRCLLQ